MQNQCLACIYFRPESDMGGTCYVNPPTVVGAPGIDPITGSANIVNVESVRPHVLVDDGCRFWSDGEPPNEANEFLARLESLIASGTPPVSEPTAPPLNNG